MAQFDRGEGLVGTLGVKAPCRVATTANITLSGLQTIDGIAVLSGDRVLVKNQTNPIDNGVWYASVGIWDRAPDMDGIKDILNGTLVTVANGTVNSGYIYRLVCATDAIPGADSLTFVAQDVTPGSLAASTGSSLIGHISSGTGAVARTMQSKLIEIINVADFGANGVITVDDSANIQKALDYCATLGGGTVTSNTSHYIANSITIPPNVSLIGPLKSIGGQAHASQNFNTVIGTIYIAPTASINVSNSCALSGFQLINNNLKTALPFANSTVAQAAVNAFSGTAVNCIGSDIFLSHLIILGFTTGIKSNDGATNWYRQKFEWIDIDCTNGIDIYKSADVPRIANVHCWDFLTFSVGIGDYSLRSGTAFKVSSNYDDGHFTNCFAFGFAIGFDINALIDVSLVDCGVDSWAANPTNPNQIGVKVQGTVTQVKIIGGSYSAVDKAISMSSAGSLIVTGGTQFFGNKTHIYATSGRLSITGNSFNYGNATWLGTVAIQIVDVSAPPLIANNVFDTIQYAFSLSTGISSVTEKATIWGNAFNNGTTDPFIGERIVSENGNLNSKIFTAYNSSGSGQLINLRKSRGTIAVPVTVNTADILSDIYTSQYNGTNFYGSSRIRTIADGVPSSTSTPGSIIFSTTTAGSNSLTDKVALNNAGWLYPMADNAYQLGGGASFRWTSVWAVNGTIQTSDKRTKDNIKDASLGLDFINKLRPVSYTWKSGGTEVIRQVYRDVEGNEVDANEPDAIPAEIITKDKVGTRTHWGLIAQEVKQAVDDAGVDFAGWVLSDINDKDSQQALRYDQFISPLIKAVQELSERVKALEA